MLLSLLLTLQSSQTVVIQGHRPATEAVVGTAAMKYLPFDVPKGVTSMEIVPEILDKEGERDTVDLGLFDPSGTGAKGFRGWQGGTRRSATITGSFATTAPWAIAGPLPAGRWSLAQYYLKSSSKGLDYRYTITFRFDGPKPPRRVPPVPVPVQEGGAPGWVVGDLHSHSLASDGALPLLDLVRRHRAAGYDFMASTEHNTPAAHWSLAEAMRAVPGITLIPGTELTTPGGHANVIGVPAGRWIDFRTQPGDGGLPKAFADARRQGAMIEVNHPYADCTSCAWTFSPEEWKDAHGIEVWNSIWDATDQKALDLWDSMLRRGRRVYAYGGSDFHRDPAPLGPATRVWAASRRAKDIVDGLRNGSAVVTQGPKGPNVELEVSADGKTRRPGDVLRADGPVQVRVVAHDADGSVLTVRTRQGLEATIDVVGGDFQKTLPLQALGFVRLELRRPNGEMLALTNPVFLP